MSDLKKVLADVKSIQRRLTELSKLTERELQTLALRTTAPDFDTVSAFETAQAMSVLTIKIAASHTATLTELADAVVKLGEHIEGKKGESLLPTVAFPPEPDWAPFEELPFNGLRCADCLEPQRETPSGTLCANGHGGTLGVP